MPERYLDALVWDVSLGITTTAQFGSDLTAWRDEGAVYMPQAFPGEVPVATVSACVEHGKAWGWPVEQIRPLAQCYTTHGVRPDPSLMNADASLAR